MRVSPVARLVRTSVIAAAAAVSMLAAGNPLAAQGVPSGRSQAVTGGTVPWFAKQATGGTVPWFAKRVAGGTVPWFAKQALGGTVPWFSKRVTGGTVPWF